MTTVQPPRIASQPASVLARGGCIYDPTSGPLNQGIGVVTGLQSKFDWRSVAASAVGAGVGQAVSGPIGDALGKGTFGARLATGLIAGGAAAIARGGKVAIQQVVVDAFGNAAAESFVDAMQPKDPLGDFINEQLAAQERRDRYGFGGVASAPGLKASVQDWDNALTRRQAPALSVADAWKQQQVGELFRAGQYEQGANLQAADIRMTDAGLRNFDDGGLGNADTVARAPIMDEALKKALQGPLPSQSVPGTGLRVPPWMIEAGKWVGKAGIGLELATFMPEAETTKWRAGGSNFAYNRDDFTLRVTDASTDQSLAIPGIHNPSQYSDAQYLSYVTYKANGGKLNINDFVSFDPPEMGDVERLSGSKLASMLDRVGNQKPEWLVRLQQGNAFNKERVDANAYPYNEVYVDKPGGAGGYFRLDSYNPETREIVSRKFTQFSAITEQTGIDYVNEMRLKYPAGTTIANVPTNIENGLAGQILRGQQILEVPVQVNPVPQAVIDAANRARVLIRDINGRIY
jgi:hypothetical protein